jgi:hypothetical protein
MEINSSLWVAEDIRGRQFSSLLARECTTHKNMLISTMRILLQKLSEVKE